MIKRNFTEHKKININLPICTLQWLEKLVKKIKNNNSNHNNKKMQMDNKKMNSKDKKNKNLKCH